MRRITVLNNRAVPGGIAVRALVRLDVPSTLRQAQPQATSIQPDATDIELSALRQGAVTEKVIEVIVPATAQVTDVQTLLQTQFSSLYAGLLASAPTTSFAGLAWDGTQWELPTSF